MSSILLRVPVLFLLLSGTVFSEVQSSEAAYDANSPPSVDIEEKLGEKIPLDIPLVDETGSAVTLSEIVKGPTIITLAYYRCRNLCPAILEGTAKALEKVRLNPVDDYSVITVSINEDESPEDARRTKLNFLRPMGKGFPDEGWRFLTGNASEVRRLADAVGFRYERQGEDFLHPSALIVISGDGRIARYLYGKSFLPFDIEMAITEAAAGKSGPSIRKAILLCFSYDPDGRRYVFNTLRVTGAAVIAGIALLAIFVTRSRKKDYH